MRVLLRNGLIYANGPQPLTSMLIAGDRIVWIGRDHSGHEADTVIDLDGRVVMPAFVDAHIHATTTGLDMLDCANVDPLHLVERFTASGEVVLAHGWDDSHWQADWFRIEALDERVGSTIVYASRIDVHSAFVSSALLALVPPDLDGWSPTGVLTRAAHAAARDIAFKRLSLSQRQRAQRRTLARASAAGVAGIQEMAGPQISSFDDAQLLQSLRALDQPHVALWWGELHGFERARELEAVGIGGDLVIDGSVGSRTAAFIDQYVDADTRGVLYQEFDELTAHITEAVNRNMACSFHAIGDAATSQILKAFSKVAERIGADRIRGGRHRLEHCELIEDHALEVMAELGIIGSVQPQFDASWGGRDGMYAHRVGRDRALRMNRFATMASAGIQLVFGSDTPVTQLDPWSTVHAAQFHRVEHERLSQRAAIAAHTRGGWRSIGVDDAGVLAEGWEATFAVWEYDGNATTRNDARLSRWSTDPRAGIPHLPDMRQAHCVMTVRRGETLFDALS